MRFSTSGSFNESVSPQPPENAIKAVFRKFSVIFAAQGAPPVSLWRREKIFHLKILSAPLFATSVADTVGKFTLGVVDTGGYLPRR
jgi:hypothetical protein